MFFPPTLIPSSSLRGSTLGKRRNFTTLNSALSQHFHIQVWKPATSFTISRDFATTASEDEFLGGTATAADTITLDLTADKIRAFCYVGTAIQGAMLEGVALAHNDGKLRNITVTWDDATNIAELFIDGVSAGTTTWLIDGNQDVKYIGKRGADYGSNTIGEIKLTDGVDDRWYKVNEDWVENYILVNHAAVLGADLYAHDGLTNWVEPRASGTLSVSGSAIRAVADGSNTYGASYMISGLTIGSTYSVTIGVDRGTHSVGWVILRYDTVPGLAEASYWPAYSTGDSGGLLSLLFTATAAIMYVGSIATSPVAGQYHEVTIGSIREAHGYGQFINGTSADAELFTFLPADNAWLGINVVDNGTFDANLDGWAASGTGGWTWENSTAKLNGDGSVQTLTQSSVFSNGDNYKISYNVEASGGQIGVQDSLGAIFVAGSTGVVSVKWVADRTTLSFKRQGGNVTGTIDNVAARKCIEVA